MYQAFPPLIQGKPKRLILGTFPSPISRGKGEYYGNLNNQFWRIIFGVFGVDFDNPCYEEKKRVLFRNGLALWDVVESCDISGALDKNIKNPVYNTKLPEFIRVNEIPAVLFNGNMAYTFYKRGIGEMPKRVMPSTSPANARLNFNQKLSIWAEALNNG